MQSLRQHQVDALEFATRLGSCAMFMEPGLGKTRVALEWLKAVGSTRALVVAPLSVTQGVWPDQIETWAPDTTYELVRGSVADRIRILKSSPASILIINYDLLRWLYELMRTDKTIRFDSIVLDESSRIKTPGSATSKAARAIAPTSRNRLIMTGTPSGNSLADLWAQVTFIDGGKRLGKNISAFRQKYCTPNMRHAYIKWDVVKPDDVMKDSADVCFVRRAEECIDMPEEIVNQIFVRLPHEALRLHDSIKSDLVLDGDPIANADVAIGKMQQVVGGFVYGSEAARIPGTRRQRTRIHDAKVEALRTLVDELNGEPLLVIYRFDEEREMIRDALGESIPSLDGSTHDSKSIIKQWNQGKFPILLGQPQSMAHGLNMQSGGYAICFYTLPWSLELYIQSIGRLARQGQKSKHVVVHHLIARQTIDEYISRALIKKNNVQETLFDFITERE